MITLTFNLDYDKMAKEGITEADMLDPMREHSKKYKIDEISNGVFAKDGEDALCVLMMYVIEKSDEQADYIRYLKSWILDTGHEVEDCKQELIKIYKKEGIIYNE